MTDPNSPWGNRGKKNNDLDDLIQNWVKTLFGKSKPKSPFGGGPDDPEKKPSGKSTGFLIGLIAIGFLLFQFAYTIAPGEKGVVMRFGEFYRTSGSGLNFLIPFVEKVTKVDVETIRKEEFGYRRSVSGAGDGADRESLMLTADKNVVQLSWVVQYKIRDPESFLFNIADPRAAVRDISESVIRRLVGNRDFNFVLNNRDELADSTKKEMQEVIDKYESGIQLVVVQLQDVNPPDSVRPSFNEVNEAEQDKIRSGNEAQRIANDNVPKALGEAKRMIEEAEGYAIERLNNAKGEVTRFNAIYAEYAKAKAVTRTRMYIETLQAVLPQVQEIVVMDNKKGAMPILNLGHSAGAARVSAQQLPKVMSPKEVR